MKSFIVLLVSVLSCTVALAQPSNPYAKFLETDKDYVIRFASQEHWSRVTVDIFTIGATRDGWVTVKYPADLADDPKWDSKRRAIAQLTEKNIDKLLASEEGKERLKKLRRLAEQEIKETQSWLNLDYVVWITEVPSELGEPKEVEVSDIEIFNELRLERRPNEQPLINDIQVPEKTDDKENADKP